MAGEKKLPSNVVSMDNTDFCLDGLDVVEPLDAAVQESADPVPAKPLRKKKGPYARPRKGRMAVIHDDALLENEAKKEDGNPRYDMTLADHEELDTMGISDMEFIFDGFPVGNVGSLVSQGGLGKTYYTLQRGVQIAVGRTWHGQRGVLYLPAEDSLDIVAARIQSIRKAYQWTDLERADAKLNFKVWSLLGQSPDLLEKKGDMRPLVDAIYEQAKTYKGSPLQLIIFDTLRRFNVEDENDGAAMSRLIGVMEVICKELGCSCLFLHHSTKTAALQGQVALQQAARGSSVLTDNIRYQEYMRPMSLDEAKALGEMDENGRVGESIAAAETRSYFVEWGVSKQNHDSPVEPVWLKRNDDGVLLPVRLGNADDKGKKGNSGRKGGKRETWSSGSR